MPNEVDRKSKVPVLLKENEDHARECVTTYALRVTVKAFYGGVEVPTYRATDRKERSQTAERQRGREVEMQKVMKIISDSQTQPKRRKEGVENSRCELKNVNISAVDGFCSPFNRMYLPNFPPPPTNTTLLPSRKPNTAIR